MYGAEQKLFGQMAASVLEVMDQPAYVVSAVILNYCECALIALLPYWGFQTVRVLALGQLPGARPVFRFTVHQHDAGRMIKFL